MFCWTQNAPNPFSAGIRPYPAGGAYNAPSDLLVGWRGRCPLPIPCPLNALRHLNLGVLKSVPNFCHRFMVTLGNSSLVIYRREKRRKRRIYLIMLTSENDPDSKFWKSWVNFPWNLECSQKACMKYCIFRMNYVGFLVICCGVNICFVLLKASSSPNQVPIAGSYLCVIISHFIVNGLLLVGFFSAFAVG